MSQNARLTDADHPVADTDPAAEIVMAVARRSNAGGMDGETPGGPGAKRATTTVAKAAAINPSIVDGSTYQPQVILWQTAASLACRLHRDQVRKDSCTPYVAHPFRVAMVVSNMFIEKDPEVAAAALLHDAIEDTPADREEIAEKVSPEVAAIVCELTKDMRLPEDERERQYIEDLKKASWQARLIKLADVYDNLCDAPTDAMRHKAMKKARDVLRVAGDDHPSLSIARAMVNDLVDAVEKGPAAKPMPS